MEILCKRDTIVPTFPLRLWKFPFKLHQNQIFWDGFIDCKSLGLILLDDVLIVYFLPTKVVTSTSIYLCRQIFVIHKLNTQLRIYTQNCTRRDILWNSNLPDSLKDFTQVG